MTDSLVRTATPPRTLAPRRGGARAWNETE